MMKRGKINLKLFSLIGFSIIILIAAVVIATSSINNPSTCSGQWTNCANSFADNTNRSTASVTGGTNKSGIWNNYGFSILNSSKISQVRVRADFFASKISGKINVQVSGDGGNTWGQSHIVGGNTAEQSYWINVTSDLDWNGNNLNNSNLRVNVTCFKSGGGANPTCNLDYIPIEVIYTPFDFTVSHSPLSASVMQARSTNTTVTVNLLGGISQNVALSYSGCPTGATCSFNPANGNPTYSSTFTVSTSSSTPAGTYKINITGTGDGKTRSSLSTFNVTVTDSKPVVSASANPSSGVVPLTVNFNGTVNGGDAPLSYFWNFSDGGTSTQQNPQHTFNSVGSYNVSFTATDFDGDSSTSYVLVNVIPACVRGTPSVLIQPDSQSGTNGTTLIYATIVNNTDSSACSSSVFTLFYGIPTGWTGFFNNNSFGLIPGAAKTVNFTITSNNIASSGNYTFNNTALNINSGFSGIDEAVYNIL